MCTYKPPNKSKWPGAAAHAPKEVRDRCHEAAGWLAPRVRIRESATSLSWPLLWKVLKIPPELHSHSPVYHQQAHAPRRPEVGSWDQRGRSHHRRRPNLRVPRCWPKGCSEEAPTRLNQQHWYPLQRQLGILRRPPPAGRLNCPPVVSVKRLDSPGGKNFVRQGARGPSLNEWPGMI